MGRDKTPNGIKKKNIKKLDNEKNGIIKKDRKYPRFRPGTVAQREIRKEQKKIEPVIPRAPFQRLVKQVAYELPYHKSTINSSLKKAFTGIRFKKSSIEALRYAAEDYLIKLFKDSKRGSEHAKRETLFVEDMRLFSDNEKSKDFSIKEGKGTLIKNIDFVNIQYEKKNIKRKEKQQIDKDIENDNRENEQLKEVIDFVPMNFI